jgi:uncharacterized protein YdhG (YjbR/CyaY superfamily)
MATSDGDRTKFFPAIEKKHGGKISQWITRVKDLGDVKYPEQIAYLREEHGFSQAHANALVMYVRGSTTSKRFATPAEYFKSLDAPTAKTSQAIFAAIQSKFPQLEKQSIFGVSASKNHLTINPFSVDVLEAHEKKLAGFVVNKYTFQVPTDWKVNASLLQSLVRTRLKEIV